MKTLQTDELIDLIRIAQKKCYPNKGFYIERNGDKYAQHVCYVDLFDTILAKLKILKTVENTVSK